MLSNRAASERAPCWALRHYCLRSIDQRNWYVIDAHCPRLIDDVARKGRRLPVDLRQRIQQYLLAQEVVADKVAVQ